jgi:hypothetical protein
MRQMEASKREYIDKLKRELDVVEEKWMHLNNENMMQGEDYRSAALQMQNFISGLHQTIEGKNAKIERDQDEIYKLQ